VEAKVPIPAARKSPVEDTLLPEMCNCGRCAVRITWQSTTLKQTRSAGRATRAGPPRTTLPKRRCARPSTLRDSIFRPAGKHQQYSQPCSVPSCVPVSFSVRPCREYRLATAVVLQRYGNDTSFSGSRCKFHKLSHNGWASRLLSNGSAGIGTSECGDSSAAATRLRCVH